jgi:drug/metabolite transporter (DMT)-like permease
LNNRTPALFAALGANLIYGLNYVVAKTIMPDFLQPRAIIVLRVVGGALFYWLLVCLLPGAEKVARKDLVRIAIASVFGITINQILFFEGLNLTSPINASIIMVNVPILVMLMSHLIIRERITTYKIIGLALGASGAAFLIMNNGNFTLSGGTALGDLLILINASSYALYLVLIKPLMFRYKPVTIVKWVFFFGAIFVMPFSIHIAWKAEWSAIPWQIWLSILYVIIFTTIIAYFLNNFSLSRISPTANSAFIYLQPVFAAVVAIILLGDVLKMHNLIAAFLIFAGVYLVSIKKKTIKNE